MGGHLSRDGVKSDGMAGFGAPALATLTASARPLLRVKVYLVHLFRAFWQRSRRHRTRFAFQTNGLEKLEFNTGNARGAIGPASPKLPSGGVVRFLGLATLAAPSDPLRQASYTALGRDGG